MQKSITWQGPFEDSGAYATINRHLVAQFLKRGWNVQRNIHNIESHYTHTLITCAYPPPPVTMRHDLNICVSNWEFTGSRGVPLSFIRAYNTYDITVGKSAWTAENYRQCGARSVAHMMLGCDLKEFTPHGQITDRAEYGIPDDAVFMLWVGGTDRRHGFDIACRVLDELPERYWLLAKQSIHYPAAPARHERLVIVREDFPSLAPLYRSADLLLHTARGVGSSMPVFECLACGTQVVTTDLPPIREIGALHADLDAHIRFADAELAYMGEHHLHADCRPYWYEPNISALVKQCQMGPMGPISDAARSLIGWERAATQLERIVLNAL